MTRTRAADDLPRDRPHPLPRNVPGPARRQPRRPGARRRHLVARGARHPRFGDRPAPERRRQPGGRRTRHGDARRRAGRGDRRRARGDRPPPAPPDEPARPAARPEPGARDRGGTGRGDRRRPLRGRRRARHRGARARGGLGRRLCALRRRDRGDGAPRRGRPPPARRHGQRRIGREREFFGRPPRISAIHPPAALRGPADPRGAPLRRPRQNRALAPVGGRADHPRAAAGSRRRTAPAGQIRREALSESTKRFD